MFWRFFLPLLLLFQPVSSALADIPKDGVVGISIFGVQSPNFRGLPCERVKSILVTQKLPALSMLYGTFGFDNRCIHSIWQEIAERGKRHVTQIHFTSEVSRKNNFMGVHGFYPKISTNRYNKLLEDMPLWLNLEIRARVRRILEMIDGYENTGTFILGAGLEDQYTQRAFDNLYEILKEEWPYTINRNPDKSAGSKIKAMDSDDFYELHHYKNFKLRRINNRCVLNGDGMALSFSPDLTGSEIQLKGIPRAGRSQVASWAQNGKRAGCVMFIWISKWQGLHVARPEEPHRRVFKVDNKDVRTTRRLVKELNGEKRRRKKKKRR